MTNNLEDDIMGLIVKEMQQEIDNNIIYDMLCEDGWTEVILESLHSNFLAVDIKIWCDENFKYSWRNSGRKFIFKNPYDATLFALRWA
jgi:hypothetical protein